MDSPYRSAPRADDVEAPRDAGIVGEVVAQFADPLAFYRELVQNAIDAGTPTVEVEVSYDAEAGAVRALVRDRGDGMDRDTVENHLLVLFRTTKDRDPTKIGKFGIGFSSVLSPAPRVVVVQTVRAGRRLTLHLHPDLSYQLFDGGAATRTGTSVELELAMAPGLVADFARRSREALVRWCRHAAVPIQFTARDERGAIIDEARVDTPLALDGALVEVRGVSADGAITAVVGLRPRAAAYAGFFNRGLMLHETDAPLAGRVAFKVLDSRLGHTLSRDDVRRDDAFERAMTLVRDLARRALARAAAVALRLAAERDLARWRALFEAIDASDLTLEPEEWLVPLLLPVDGVTAVAPAMRMRSVAWAAHAQTPVVEAMAAAGIPVLALSAGGIDAEAVKARVARTGDLRLIDVAATLTLVESVPLTVADHALLDLLGHFLERAVRRPRAIVVADLSGPLAVRTCVAGGADDALIEIDDRRWVIDLEVGTRNPMARWRRPALVLNAADPLIAAARRRADADGDAIGAASLLARAVLLQHQRLDAAASEAVLAATVERLEGSR